MLGHSCTRTGRTACEAGYGPGQDVATAVGPEDQRNGRAHRMWQSGEGAAAQQTSAVDNTSLAAQDS